VAYPQAHQNQKFTYADYLTWPDDERWELIDGVAYPWNGIHAMSPGPSRSHQALSRELLMQFANYLKNRTCKIYNAPLDVRLADVSDASDNYVETVVQPDLLVVCDPAKLDEKGCNGAPDLIVEIVSKSTASKDLQLKFELYQRNGVKEYWVIHPAEHSLLVFKRGEDGRYGAADRYADKDAVPVTLLGDLVVHLDEVFADE